MIIHSFIHIEHLNRTSSRELLRGALDSSTAKKSSLKVRKKTQVTKLQYISWRPHEPSTQNLGNRNLLLSPSVRSTFLSGSLSSSFSFLKTYSFSWGLAHWQHFLTVHPTRRAIQMFLIQYNIVQPQD